MIYLQPGSSNATWVEAWQAFAVGEFVEAGEPQLAERVGGTDGIFGNSNSRGTRWATKELQSRWGTSADGKVGKGTLRLAIDHGFDPPDSWLRKALDQGHIDEPTYDRLADTDLRPERVIPANDVDGYMDPAWPQPLDADGDGRRDLTYVSAKALLGEFAWKADPQSRSGGILITDGWDKQNVVTLDVPQLAGVRRGRTSVRWHRRGAAQLLGFWQEVEDAGLLHLLLSWAGSFVPRYIRGSVKSLSNHSWAVAFDINVAQNGLGKQPALVGQKGSVRQLVPIAEKWGFYWGGFYRRRKDGMHFELTRLLSDEEIAPLLACLSTDDHITPWLQAA